jgi:S1-C subfamily serine protease
MGSLVAGATVLAVQVSGHAQSSEAVGKIAAAITVRIEGATQGSGVLVKREGNRYTVLTAWHVVSGQRSGEELDIYTPDRKRYPVQPGSIRRLGEVDLAVLSFTSPDSYELARLGNLSSISSGSRIYVSGFPFPAITLNAVPNGYQLLYSSPTLPGMSGGAVLNDQGQLLGIHGQGETDSQMSEQQGIAVKTGTNQAVPIDYYRQYASSEKAVTPSSQAATADDDRLDQACEKFAARLSAAQASGNIQKAQSIYTKGSKRIANRFNGATCQNVTPPRL